jgi:hypothetical protein
MSKSGVATIIAGLGLLIPASLGLLVSNVPTILCPFPALTVVPAFLLLDFNLSRVAVAVPTMLFFVWHPRLFRGAAKVPKRSYLLLIITTLLAVADFVASWSRGLRYQGPRHTYFVCAVKIAWVGFLITAFARSWKASTTFRFSLLLHWMFFAWLAWYAFPDLGELP